MLIASVMIARRTSPRMVRDPRVEECGSEKDAGGGEESGGPEGKHDGGENQSGVEEVGVFHD